MCETQDPTFSEKFVTFTKPFETRLWITFLAISAATGLVYLMLEAKSDNGDTEPDAPALTRIVHSVHLSLGRFTGATSLSVHWPWHVLAPG